MIQIPGCDPDMLDCPGFRLETGFCCAAGKKRLPVLVSVNIGFSSLPRAGRTGWDSRLLSIATGRGHRVGYHLIAFPFELVAAWRDKCYRGFHSIFLVLSAFRETRYRYSLWVPFATQPYFAWLCRLAGFNIYEVIIARCSSS